MVFENYMFLNAGKCHFTCLGKNAEGETFIFKDTIMNNIKKKKNTRFYQTTDQTNICSYIRELYKKASQKISTLSRISNQLNDSEKNLLPNAVVKSQINSFPPVWMFCSRTSNNIINSVHKRAFRVILGDNLSESFFCKIIRTYAAIIKISKAL